MASLDELPAGYRLALSLYPWRRLDPVPWAPLRGPLAKARVAVVSSAGLYRPGDDTPFQRRLGGDHSFRLLPAKVDLSSLALGQTSHSFDRGAVERDPASVFPVPHLQRLVQAGLIGSVADIHVSINGAITAPGLLHRQTGPAVAAALRRDRVDAALLVPV